MDTLLQAQREPVKCYQHYNRHHHVLARTFTNLHFVSVQLRSSQFLEHSASRSHRHSIVELHHTLHKRQISMGELSAGVNPRPIWTACTPGSRKKKKNLLINALTDTLVCLLLCYIIINATCTVCKLHHSQQNMSSFPHPSNAPCRLYSLRSPCRSLA